MFNNRTDTQIIHSAGQATWVVSPAGCATHPGTTCSESRGGLYNRSQSASWSEIGNFSLGLGKNFGYDILNATYGLDTVSLGIDNVTGGPTLPSQVVAALAPEFYYLGLFGLNPQPTNWTNFENPRTSYLMTLKQEGMIPSLSWAYTVGAQYSKRFLSNFFLRCW